MKLGQQLDLKSEIFSDFLYLKTHTCFVNGVRVAISSFLTINIKIQSKGVGWGEAGLSNLSLCCVSDKS